MEDINNVLAFYSTKWSDQFNKLSEVLKDLLLDGFWYSYVRQDGGFFQIGNRPDVAEVYFSNRFYVHNAFVCHPKNYQHNQALITSDFPDPNFHDAQKVVGNKSGMGNNFLFIYKQCGTDMHCLHFGSSQQNIPLNSIFLDNLQLLKSFSDHFLKEWTPHFRHMDSFMINIASDMGSKFYEINPKIRHLNDKSRALKVLRRLGLIDDEYYDTLTARELECIEEFLCGKTARQIGASLYISHRTVEHHLETIKSKLGCSSKLELFEKLQKLEKFNIQLSSLL
jgi:DNA-binding CsgD family transcriptional regulator